MKHKGFILNPQCYGKALALEQSKSIITLLIFSISLFLFSTVAWYFDQYTQTISEVRTLASSIEFEKSQELTLQLNDRQDKQK